MSKKRSAAEAPASEPAGVSWLDALERRVRHAVERLSALTAENRRLRARLAELERAAEGGEGGEPPIATEPDGWGHEREQIRARVERLTTTLEELLSDTDASPEDEAGD